jgi:hypothetical protein
MDIKKDLASEICEMHSKGFRPITIAALLQIPVNMVVQVVADYCEEYDHAFGHCLETE